MSEVIFNESEHSLSTPHLRLAFVWTEDRWTHKLEIDGQAVAQPLEIEPSHEHPARVVSPAYQQLNFQAGGGPGAYQALLVGQTGPHHFAAVFTLSSDDESSTLEVDFADRSRSMVEALAATYTVFLTSSSLDDASTRQVRWQVGDRTVSVESLDAATLSIAESGRTATRVQVLAQLDATRKTQRCRYRWAVKNQTLPATITGVAAPKTDHSLES